MCHGNSAFCGLLVMSIGNYFVLGLEITSNLFPFASEVTLLRVSNNCL